MAALRKRSKLLAFLACGVAVMAAGDLLSSALRLDYHQGDRWNFNISAFQRSGLRSDILFIGSSHMVEGINSTLVAETLAERGASSRQVYNLSQPGANVLMSYIVLRDAIRTNGCPAVVGIEVSPGGFNRTGEWRPRLPELITLRELPMVLPALITTERVNDVLGSPLRGLHRLFDGLVYPAPASEIEDVLSRGGSLYDHLPETAGPERVMGRTAIMMGRNVYRRDYWRSFELSSLQQRALEGLVGLCRDCSAHLMLIRLPNLALHDRRDIERIDRPWREFLTAFAAERGLTYVDLHWGEPKIGPEHFRNAAHLNIHGATLISRHLAAEWLAPLLRETV